jgi:D-alanyl-D-alanine carboxypeptidase/D-alanyl-D-alanine-endopeptidase (penicillin-binding protein 4)
MKSLYLKILLFVSLTFLLVTGCKTSKKVVQPAPAKQASPFAVMLDTSKVFSSNLTGFALYDPESDSLIYGQNEDRYFTPASNTKLYTFYTGLKLLPDSLRALEYVVRGDSLIFWGTGDPSFLHPEIGNGKVYEFLKHRDEKLIYSDANFDDELQGPGWAWDDYKYYYQTEKTPLPVYGNTVAFDIEEINLRQVALNDSGLAISPKIFRSYVRKESRSEKDEPIVFRNLADNQFLYKPYADTSTHTIHKPYHYTPELLVQMLSDTLDKEVAYKPIEKPDSTHSLYSIDADTAYKHMLLPSDNFIAEQLLFVAASELGMSLNSESIIEKMETEYLDLLPQKPQWVDGSGLSRYNMFTPQSMIRLLREIDKEFDSDEKLFELLPAGGESGTIEDWYSAQDGDPPYVFAKTGTLSNNHSLSGYVITSSGKKLIFSFMNNHYVSSTSVVQNEMNKVLRYIHQSF